MVDAAHSFAHFDYQLPALDADFIATNLHKWFGAPLGTGLLFIRQSKLADIQPLYGRADHTPLPRPIQRLAAPGTVAVPALLNIRNALDFQRSIGLEQKEKSLRYLTQYWLQHARQIPQLQVITPSDPAHYCAIAAFTMIGRSVVATSANFCCQPQSQSVAAGPDHCTAIYPTGRTGPVDCHAATNCSRLRDQTSAG